MILFTIFDVVNPNRNAMTRSLILSCIPVLFIISCSTPKKNGAPLSYDPPGSTNTKTKPIDRQEKGTFTQNGISVNNEFDGARMNGFEKLSDSLYRVTIHPENAPINMSPWYAFKIKSTIAREVYLHMKYRDGKHRYYPDRSDDGVHWQPLDSNRYKVYENDSVILKLRLTNEYQWISAQELLTSEDNEKWTDQIATQNFVTKETIGKSREGKEINSLKIALTSKQPLLVVISRQHPPEVTGYMAMKAFVEELTSHSELAQQFREKFGIVVLPMLNPDGVDNGHWRHNTGGVDLNRDWQYYNQPEIDQFQKYIHQLVKTYKLNVVLGLDFHSTHQDLLYTFNNETFPDRNGVVKTWIKRLREEFPNETITEEDGGAESPVSKNWFLNEFKAEAVTYEVGDDTPRKFVRAKGEASARIFMELLLQKYEK